jgi:hypothetical protein
LLLSLLLVYHFSETLSLFAIQSNQEIAIPVLKQFECHGQMVLLQHGLIIVHYGQFILGIDQILIGESGMVNIMD